MTAGWIERATSKRGVWRPVDVDSSWRGKCQKPLKRGRRLAIKWLVKGEHKQKGRWKTTEEASQEYDIILWKCLWNWVTTVERLSADNLTIIGPIQTELNPWNFLNWSSNSAQRRTGIGNVVTVCQCLFMARWVLPMIGVYGPRPASLLAFLPRSLAKLHNLSPNNDPMNLPAELIPVETLQMQRGRSHPPK